MFEHSETWQRMKGEDASAFQIHLGYVPQIEHEEEHETRRFRIAVALAILFHVGLLLLNLPDIGAAPKEIGSRKPVFLVKPIRFKPPPPAQQQQLPKPREKRRIIPIPDPTPDEPEPLIVEDIAVPEIDVSYEDAVYGVPDAPPGFGRTGPEPMEVGGAVRPPVKIYYPSPRYTEEARQAQIQGVVILRAVIDAEGDVTEVELLKGLPMGLAEAALETARQWKFKPATMDGRPVPVYFNLTISFSLQ